MSGSRAAAEALKAIAHQHYTALWQAGANVAGRHIEVRRTEDLVEVMQATIDMLVATEQLQEAADEAVAALRAKLGEQMMETGATTVQASHHTAYLSRKPAFVSIDDESKVPAEYVVQKSSFDKRAIAAAIKDGKQVTGASLLTPNEQVLVLRSRKEAA